jgi:hypothetical protein
MGHRIKVHLQSSPKVGFLCENAINPKLTHQKRFLVDRFRRCFEPVQTREDGV